MHKQVLSPVEFIRLFEQANDMDISQLDAQKICNSAWSKYRIGLGFKPERFDFSEYNHWVRVAKPLSPEYDKGSRLPKDIGTTGYLNKKPDALSLILGD